MGRGEQGGEKDGWKERKSEGEMDRGRMDEGEVKK